MLKDITLTTQCFLFVLFLVALLQQVFCNIPANQIIISTYGYLLYKFRIKIKEKITQTTHWLKSFYWISLPITKMKLSKGCAPTRIWRPSWDRGVWHVSINFDWHLEWNTPGPLRRYAGIGGLLSKHRRYQAFTFFVAESGTRSNVESKIEKSRMDRTEYLIA